MMGQRKMAEGGVPSGADSPSDDGPALDVMADARRDTAHDWFELAIMRLVSADSAFDVGGYAIAVSDAVSAFHHATIGRFIFDGIPLEREIILNGQLPPDEAAGAMHRFLQVMNKHEVAKRALSFTHKPNEFYTPDDARRAIDMAILAVRLVASSVDPSINPDDALSVRRRMRAGGVRP